MIDVLFYDDRGGFGPTFNSERAVGGAEMHLVQIAEHLALRHGLSVAANVHTVRSGITTEGGVVYGDPRLMHPWQKTKTLIVVGCASLPAHVTAERTFAFQVVDPRPVWTMFEHLKGRAVMVCVSDWQADQFRRLGHTAVVIPVPIPDEWYGAARMNRALPLGFFDFGCFSSWNKGAAQTIEMWNPDWGTLAVGSPYSHPDTIPRRLGVTFLGTLRPREKWIQAMLSVGAIARVCTIGETFGVVDVAARAMGLDCYTLCTGDVGSLREVGARPFTDPAELREAIRQRTPHPTGEAERFRASRVLPMWLELIKGKGV